MSLIDIQNISKTVGDKTLFKNVTFTITQNEKYGLLGANGTGKSTLLKILNKKIDFDEGEIIYRNNTLISTLEQTPQIDESITISQYIDKTKIDRFNFISYLDKCGISDISQNISTLSGGTKKKISLVETLLVDSDIIFLDEPTNHLDIKTIEFLETELQKTNKTIFLVTHDRYFLQNICTKIIEIENQEVVIYNGNYLEYLEKKQERSNAIEKLNQKYKSILRYEYKWLQRGARARSTKQKARIERVEVLENSITDFKKDNLSVEILPQRLGNKILIAKDISKKYDDNEIINNFSYNFHKFQKVGIIGDNGSGKTTLLKLLTKQESIDNGIIEIGETISFGIFDQHSDKLDNSAMVYEFIKKEAENIQLSDGSVITISKMLDKFLFPKTLHYTKIGDLSGGEKRRLYLLYILLKNPNFIVLDEPTNDLDIQTLTILEDYLINFKGNVLVVSHDRFFIDKIVDTLLIIENKKIINYPGNYSDYFKEQHKKIKREQKNSSNSSYKKDKPKEKTKLTFKEQKEFENIEKEIEDLERRVSEIEELFSSGKNDFDFEKTTKEYNQLKIELEKKLERWEYLAQYA